MNFWNQRSAISKFTCRRDGSNLPMTAQSISQNYMPEVCIAASSSSSFYLLQ